MRDVNEIKEYLKNKTENKKSNNDEIAEIDKIIKASESVIPDISPFEKENIRTNIMAKIDSIPVKRNRISSFLRWSIVGSTGLILILISFLYFRGKVSRENTYYSYIIDSTAEEYFYSEFNDSTENISDEDLVNYLENNPGIVDYYKSL